MGEPKFFGSFHQDSPKNEEESENLAKSKTDVDDFNAFRRSDDVKPLRDDIKNYTNCEPEWTVAKVVMNPA